MLFLPFRLQKFNNSKRGSRPMTFASSKFVRFTTCITTILIALAVASQTGRAQEVAKHIEKPGISTAASEPTVSERVRNLESELERQNAKLDQLQKTILEQQNAIQALLAKISAD